MKVLLIGNFPPDRQTSMLAFQAVMQRELQRTGCDVRLVAPRALLRRLPWPRRLEKWVGYVDKFVLFPLGLGRHLRWADVVHVTDHSNAMYVPRTTPRPTLVTCHDVIAIQAARGLVPGWNVGASGRLLQRLIEKGLGRADAVACVSHLTERDLLGLGLAPRERVGLVLNGLNAAFAPVPAPVAAPHLQQLGLAPTDRYLMHIGLDLPRKNRIQVLRAFIALQRRARDRAQPAAALDRLLFVGPPLSPEMAGEARAAGVLEQLIVAQDVSHDALCALYSNATALLFPSLQEGFGWPVIEAQACGCPVVTSDLAPMNEIGSRAAEYADPLDAEALADAVERALPRLDDMRRLGLANAAHYSTETMTRNYVDTYRRLLAAQQGATA